MQTEDNNTTLATTEEITKFRDLVDTFLTSRAPLFSENDSDARIAILEYIASTENKTIYQHLTDD